MPRSEFQLIDHFFSHDSVAFARDGVELGIGDDAAIISVKEDRVICMSMDVLIPDVHFPASADPFLIGQRALAVNLSDLAAMAAEPLCFTLGLAMPSADDNWLQGFRDGLAKMARQYNCPLVGGDTTGGPGSIAIQVQGTTDRDLAVTRSGASPGDAIYVSGPLGNGALALAAQNIAVHFDAQFQPNIENLSVADHEYLRNQFYAPEPRINFALATAHLLSSAIDISDGLAGDLGHVLSASQCGAVIQASALPYSDPARKICTPAECVAAALYGGDDYELCVTASGSDCAELEAIASGMGLTLHKIGEVVAGHGYSMVLESGEAVAIEAKSYAHFHES